MRAPLSATQVNAMNPLYNLPAGQRDLQRRVDQWNADEALAHKLAELERKIEGHDTSIRTLFDAIRELAAPPAKPRGEIGFHIKEDSVPYRAKRK